MLETANNRTVDTILFWPQEPYSVSGYSLQIKQAKMAENGSTLDVIRFVMTSHSNNMWCAEIVPT